MDKYLDFNLDDGTRVQLGVRINQELLGKNEFRYWSVGYGEEKKFDVAGNIPIIPSSVDTLKQQLEALDFPEQHFHAHTALLLSELLYCTTFSRELEMWNPLEPLPASHSGWILMGVVDSLPWGFNIFSSETKVFKEEEEDVDILLDILGKLYKNTGRVFTRGFPGGIEPMEEPRFYFKMYYPQEELFSACSKVLSLGGYKLPPMVPLNLEPQYL